MTLPAPGVPILWDANVLIARTFQAHEHHAAVVAWDAAHVERFATTPITQGSLIRFLVRTGSDRSRVAQILDRFTRRVRHELWSDDLEYDDAMLSRVRGHADVTDAYLAALARHHHGKLATLDRRLGDLHPDVAEVIPT